MKKLFIPTLNEVKRRVLNEVRVPILLGTGRQGRRSEYAAKFVLEKIKEYGFETELVDAREYATSFTIPPWQPELQKKTWRAIMKKAQGLIIVSPEYNHGYPGELKIVLDQLYEEYFQKPVGVCGVSTGRLGGARMVEQLRQVLIEFRMIPLRNAVYFSNVGELFDTQGKIKDPEPYKKSIKTLLDELSSYIKLN
ncbi:MAG: NAD(P)H-dependent oxidoreductase [Candidatus Portnoybacteria bacterium]|nr:NAD(P)H-dependent oxidoreductase [Candidatus Portnoybacteria bacterium]